MKGDRTRQVAFRLPVALIDRIAACEAGIRETGLNLSRTDIVRLLLTYALDQSDGDVAELLGIPKGRAKRAVDGKADGKGDSRSATRRARS